MGFAKDLSVSQWADKRYFNDEQWAKIQEIIEWYSQKTSR